MPIIDAIQRVRARLSLTVGHVVALVAGIAAVGVSAAGLFGVGEDVTQRNGLYSSDASNLRVFVDHRPGLLVSAARAVTDLGAVPLLMIPAVAVAGLLWWRGQRLIVAAAPTIALVVAGALAAVAKQLVDRPRPAASLRLVTETEPSFPSGHTTDTTAFYLTCALILAVFVLRRPLARVAIVGAAGALATAVGLSRLVLGVHWPTDVLAGWALGVGVAVTVVTAVFVATRLTTTPSQPGPRRVGQLLAVLNKSRATEPGIHLAVP